MTEPLPDLSTKVKGDVSDLIAALTEAKAAMKAYQDETTRTSQKTKENNDKSSASDKDYARLVTANVKGEVSALQDLQRAYDQTKIKRDALRSEAGRTGNVGVFGDLKSTEADLSKLSGYIKDMGGQSDVISQAFAETESSAAGLLPIAASLAAFFAPLLGGVVGGSVLALLGGGGLAAGVAGQLHSPQVQSALGTFRAEVSDAFHGATEQFAPDTAKALSTVGASTSKMLDELQPAFTRLAPYLDQFAQGIANAEDMLLPGLIKGLDAAGPIIGAIADDLPMLANALSIFLEQLAEGGKGAGEALTVLLDILGAVIVATGYTIGDLSKGFDKLVRGIRDVTGAITETERVLHIADPVLGGLHDQLDQLTGDTKHLSEANASVSDSSRESAGAVNELTYAYENLNSEFLKYENEAQKVDDANLTMHRDILQFHTDLQKGARYWDLNTKAGQAQVEKLDQVNKGITAYYDTLRVNGQLTNDQTKAELDALKSQRDLAKAYGASDDELKTLNGEISNLQAQLNGLPKSKTVSINVNVHASQIGKVDNTLARFGGAGANSGIVGQLPSFSDSGVFAGGPQPVYRMAEQSTGQEALIAQHGDKNRALSTLAEATSWFADDISSTTNHNINNSYSVSDGGGASGTVVNLYMDSRKVATGIIGPVNRMNRRSSANIYGATSS